MKPTKQDDSPVTVAQLAMQLSKFYDAHIHPSFQEVRKDIKILYEKLNNHDGRFDDLYKKFETVHQEILISNHQIRRLTYGFETFRSAFADLNRKLGQID